MPYRAETTLIRMDVQHLQDSQFLPAVAALRRGGLVAFPTETVYGLGANAFDALAVANIFSAKERPANDPLIVHLADQAQLATVARHVTPQMAQIAALFWPGALTLIMQRHPDIPDAVTSGQDTVAVRVPAHPIARQLILLSGMPLAAPSANRFSRPSPTSAAHVLADLSGRVDVVLDGGSTRIGVESTILDLTGTVPTILRPGGVSLEALRVYLPHVVLHSAALHHDARALAPGMLLRHYSPDGEVLLFTGENRAQVDAHMRHLADSLLTEGKRVAILLPDDHAAAYDGLAATVMSLGDDATHAASQLFACLRTLESAQTEVILVRAPHQEGIGLAIWDRLWRAAEGRLVTVAG